MAYLCIENPGKAPIQGFTVLGVSSSRGTDKIGQFGSGAKHGVNILLRSNIDLIIYSGMDRLVFHKNPEQMGDTIFNRVSYQVNDNPPEKTGFALEFGEIDWTSVEMALREFISNAIDQHPEGQELDLSFVRLVETPEPSPDKTRVFIECTAEVAKYFNERKKYFLHFDRKEKESVLLHGEARGPRLYRRGVFVRELQPRGTSSMFDYNIHDMEIDECRNLNDSRARELIGKVIFSVERAFRDILNASVKGFSIFETTQMALWDFPNLGKDQIPSWMPRFFQGVKITDSCDLYEYAKRKGIPAWKISPPLYYRLQHHFEKVEYNNQVLDSCQATEFDPTPELLVHVSWVWQSLVEAKLTFGRPKPRLRQFSLPMDAGACLMGCWQNDTVYISSDATRSTQTILEELGHHITQAGDNSRDFQDWAFRAAAVFLDQSRERAG